jgi:ABC-2 type transport system ATP-binding protein
MDYLIEAQSLNKTYGHTQAVQDLHLQVKDGEIYGLIGPDGAGKTTTMRLLCGGLRPDAGRKMIASQARNEGTLIRIAGYDLHRQPEKARAQIGYLAQRFALYEDLTVLENIRFFAELRGLPSAEWRQRCTEILEFVDLAPFQDRRAGQLSGGMKQKLGLAAALVHRPRVLLLDEPTSGVDPLTRQDFWQLIIGLVAEEEVALLVSTPYMDEASRCSRVGFMQKGRLIVEGTPAELRQNLDDRIVELRGQPLARLRVAASADPQVEEVQMFGDRLHLRVQKGSAESVIARLTQAIPSHGGQITRLRLIQPQLEDVFISLVESHL